MPAWKELPLPSDAERVASRVRGAAIRVHRRVGAGFRENIYQKCLAHELHQAGHDVHEHATLTVRYDDLVLTRAAEADMIVDGRVVVEVKARESIHPTHEAQVVGYLRATDAPIGLLFNFHAPVLMGSGYRRVVHPKFLQFLP